MNNQESKTLFFDIETRPSEDAVNFITPKSAPSNWKDPEKIKAYEEKSVGEQLQKSALDPDLGEIVAISYALSPDSETYVITQNTRSEYHLLKKFWKLFAYTNGACCGYNIIGFDLPYILRRSFFHRIAPKIRPDLRRYQDFPTIDLMCLLYNWERNTKSLKWVTKRYGIKDEMPDAEGSQVGDMDWDTLKLYAKNGTDLAKRLYREMYGTYFIDTWRFGG